MLMNLWMQLQSIVQCSQEKSVKGTAQLQGVLNAPPSWSAWVQTIRGGSYMDIVPDGSATMEIHWWCSWTTRYYRWCWTEQDDQKTQSSSAIMKRTARVSGDIWFSPCTGRNISTRWGAAWRDNLLTTLPDPIVILGEVGGGGLANLVPRPLTLQHRMDYFTQSIPCSNLHGSGYKIWGRVGGQLMNDNYIKLFKHSINWSFLLWFCANFITASSRLIGISQWNRRHAGP